MCVRAPGEYVRGRASCEKGLSEQLPDRQPHLITMQQLNQPCCHERDAHTRTHTRLRADALNMQILHMAAFILWKEGGEKKTFLICRKVRGGCKRGGQVEGLSSWRMEETLQSSTSFKLAAAKAQL